MQEQLSYSYMGTNAYIQVSEELTAPQHQSRTTAQDQNTVTKISEQKHEMNNFQIAFNIKSSGPISMLIWTQQKILMACHRHR